MSGESSLGGSYGLGVSAGTCGESMRMEIIRGGEGGERGVEARKA